MSALPSVGSRIGKYRVISEIGRGGMGVVYKCYDPELDRSVAVKVLAPQLVPEEEAATRFIREAQAVARLKHPGIVTIYDTGQEGSWSYYVMEYLEGDSLTALIANRGAPAGAELISILQSLAEALDYAHQSGLVHRDIKPSNIFVGQVGQVTLTDFGMVHAPQGTTLTAAGQVVGSPGYMSPEQAQSQPLDGRSDQYSLAVVAFELLGGQVPFQGDGSLSLIDQVVHEPLPSIRSMRRDLPESVQQVLATALAKDPAQRYGSVTDFVKALARALGVETSSGSLPWFTSLPLPAAVDEDILSAMLQPAAPGSAEPAAGAVEKDEPEPQEVARPVEKEGPKLRETARPVEKEEPEPREAVRPTKAPVKKRGIPIWAMALAGLGLVAVIAIAVLWLRPAGLLSPAVITKVVTSTPEPLAEIGAMAGQVTAPAAISDKITPTSTATPTPSPTPSVKPSDTPSPTSSPSPTATATRPAPTPTWTPTRTPTRAPTRTPAPLAPVGLLSPDDGTRFPRDSSIPLTWTSVGDLAGDVCYVVTVTYTKDGQTVTDDEKWVQTTSWDLAEHSYLPGLSDDGYFYWSVQVRRRDGGVNGTGPGAPLNQSSVIRSLFWGKGPKPTATPSEP